MKGAITQISYECEQGAQWAIGAIRCDDKCANTVSLETQAPCGSERKCSGDTVTHDTSVQVKMSQVSAWPGPPRGVGQYHASSWPRPRSRKMGGSSRRAQQVLDRKPSLARAVALTSLFCNRSSSAMEASRSEVRLPVGWSTGSRFRSVGATSFCLKIPRSPSSHISPSHIVAGSCIVVLHSTEVMAKDKFVDAQEVRLSIVVGSNPCQGG